MKHLYALCFALFLLFISSVHAQSDTYDSKGPARPATIGFSINFYDFSTASSIRNSSLEAVWNDESGTKIKDMAPGLSIHYGKGLTSSIDFAASVGFGTGTLVLQNKPAQTQSGGFVIADASAQFKMLPEDFVVIPYLSAGVGAMAAKGYYGAVLPLGVGLRFRLSDETSVGLQSQYRVAITETAGYHFMHGLSITSKL